MNRPAFFGVLLAAGASTRMGRDKALLPWPPSHPTATFLSGALDALSSACEMVTVVVGENEPALQSIIYSRAAYLVRNPDPSRGQTSSLRLGLKAVLNRGRDAAIVMLVDRPPVSVETLHTLKNALRESLPDIWAVAPQVNGVHGHPLLLSRDMMEAILRSPEDAIARDIIAQHQHRMRYVEVDDPNAVLNINTPEEYENATRSPGDTPRS